MEEALLSIFSNSSFFRSFVFLFSFFLFERRVLREEGKIYPFYQSWRMCHKRLFRIIIKSGFVYVDGNLFIC